MYLISMMKHTLVAALFTLGACSALQAIAYTVNTTADNGDNISPIPGSLRAAIIAVNSAPPNSVSNISFGITTGTAPFIIQPQVFDLPAITNPVIIDGYTQMGSSPNSSPQGSNATLAIVINGSNYTQGDGVTSGNGLTFAGNSAGSVVRGLVINQWLGNGILVEGVSGIKVIGCFIGTDYTGTQVQANRTGIGLSRTTGTIIGTPATVDYNVIAGSFSWFITDNYGLRGACIFSLDGKNISITNNSIGTDLTGMYALGNSSVGIFLRSDQNGTVTNNVVSGHSIFGIRLRATGNCTVQNNYVGTDITGTLALGNGSAGIELDDNNNGVSNYIIGNLVSGNRTGIRIGQFFLPGSTMNTVQGNRVGTDVTGTTAVPNEEFGIILNDGQNTVGGSEAGQGNVISGNLGGGILLYGTPNTTANVVANNFIGTDITGTQPLPNEGNGVQIGLNGGLGGSSDNTIGTSSPLLGTTLQSAKQFKKQKIDGPKRQRKGYSAIGSSLKVKTHSTEPVISMPQIEKSIKELLSRPAQTIGLNFTAATVGTALAVSDPDAGESFPSGWVGPQQYILTTYGIIRSFDKSTGLPDGVLNIDAGSFMGTVSEDPRINYSRFLDRWFISCENGPTSTELIVAWSDSGVITPETVWTIITFSNTDLASPAYVYDNQLATDANAVYISVDTSDNTSYLGVSTVVIPNSEITTGNTSPAFTVLPGILPNTSNQGAPPADNFDQDAQFGYIVNAFDSTQLYFYRILNPGSSQAILGQQIVLNVPAYAKPANAPHEGNLYTLNNSTIMYIETSSGTPLHAPHVRNKQLYICHPTQVNSEGLGTPAGDRVGIRWYQFDLTGDPTGNGCGIETETTCPALVQWGTLFDSAAENPKFYYVPAIMTNKNGDLVIEGTVSGTNNYTNVFYAGRQASDPLGTLRNPVLVTNNTSNPFNFGVLNGQSWGVYSTLAPDPSNDLILWSSGTWAAIENGWGVQATQLLPAQ